MSIVVCVLVLYCGLKMFNLCGELIGLLDDDTDETDGFSAFDENVEIRENSWSDVTVLYFKTILEKN